MREFKFRVWDKTNEKMFTAMISFNLDDGVHSCTFISNYGDEITSDIKDLVIMQFTGLLDKNGKEIYEGDILKSSGEIKLQLSEFPKEIYSPYWELSEVVFHKGAFMRIIRAQENSWFGKIPSDPQKIFNPEEHEEIVGNVYETPELIKNC